MCICKLSRTRGRSHAEVLSNSTREFSIYTGVLDPGLKEGRPWAGDRNAAVPRQDRPLLPATSGNCVQGLGSPAHDGADFAVQSCYKASCKGKFKTVQSLHELMSCPTDL